MTVFGTQSCLPMFSGTKLLANVPGQKFWGQYSPSQMLQPNVIRTIAPRDSGPANVTISVQANLVSQCSAA
ncbi:hypothetical protein NDN08_002299 [Rhodosorus marinus]|uniref:Uncharacterized protein n=1 Tax=Rhodosorus marinus TaxID=101924 RepID=A0AAV8UTC2_9RHOD|nr:hypothetical protein NDN08_002299 [Rhodosorus marinus]